MKRSLYTMLTALFLVVAARGDDLLPGASSAEARADRLKAAYTLNFLKFVEWPGSEAKDQTLRVSVIGSGSIAAAIQTAVERKTVQGRLVSVTWYATLTEWKTANCATTSHAIFLTAATKPDWGDLLRTIAGRPVLTISDSDEFCSAGGMLDLFESDNHIRFNANPGAAALAGLKIRSDLLKLAILAKTAEAPP